MRSILTCGIAATLAVAGAAERTVALSVDGGAAERRDAPVRVALRLPAELARAQRISVKGPDGAAVPGQLTAPALLSTPAQGEGEAVELCFVARRLGAGASSWTATIADGAADGTRFAWHEEKNVAIELRHGERPVLRYECRPLDEAAREESFKVFHHLFAPDGKRITKGPGGRYTHHRGLFFGYAKVSGDGVSGDIWHGKGAHQQHAGVLASEAGPVVGSHRVAVDWIVGGKALAREEREVCAWSTAEGTVIDVAMRLTPLAATIDLNGDPQHAGVHVRLDEEVNASTAKKTVYIRPDGVGAPGVAIAAAPVRAWDAISAELGGRRVTVAYLDHPANPKEKAMSSERDYGRFGTFIPCKLAQGKTLDLRYRLWISLGQAEQATVAARAADFVEAARAAVR